MYKKFSDGRRRSHVQVESASDKFRTNQEMWELQEELEYEKNVNANLTLLLRNNKI